MATPLTVQTHAAAFLVALVEAGMLDQAESFVEWCQEELELTEKQESHLIAVLPAELEEDF